MTIFLARFEGDLLPCIIDEATHEAAIGRIEQETGRVPVVLIPVPIGVLFAEVKFATEDRPTDDNGEASIEEDENPANHSAMGVVCEPFEGFAEWLEEIDDTDLADVLAEATAAAEASAGAPDGG